MKITWLNLFIDRNVIVNSPSMPAKPTSSEIYDTRADYRKERVSHGDGYSSIYDL